MSKSNNKSPLKGGTAFLKGNNCLENKNYVQAINEFTDALEFLPDGAEILEDAYWGRGLAYYYINEYGYAISDFNHAIEINPTYLTAYSSRGGCYLETQEWEKAASDFELALSLDYDNWHEEATKRLEASGKLEQMQVKFENHYGAAMAYNQLRQFSKCLNHLESAYEIKKSPQILDYIEKIRVKVKIQSMLNGD